MNQVILMEGGVDCILGVERCMGNEALYERLLRRFLTDTSMEKAIAGFAAGDYETAHMGLHAFKGVCGSLGMTEMFKLSTDMLHRIKDGRYEGLSEDFERLSLLNCRALAATHAALDAE